MRCPRARRKSPRLPGERRPRPRNPPRRGGPLLPPPPQHPMQARWLRPGLPPALREFPRAVLPKHQWRHVGPSPPPRPPSRDGRGQLHPRPRLLRLTPPLPRAARPRRPSLPPRRPPRPAPPSRPHPWPPHPFAQRHRPPWHPLPPLLARAQGPQRRGQPDRAAQPRPQQRRPAPVPRPARLPGRGRAPPAPRLALEALRGTPLRVPRPRLRPAARRVATARPRLPWRLRANPRAVRAVGRAPLPILARPPVGVEAARVAAGVAVLLPGAAIPQLLAVMEVGPLAAHRAVTRLPPAPVEEVERVPGVRLEEAPGVERPPARALEQARRPGTRAVH